MASYTTTACPFCDWDSRTHLFPRHIVNKHPEKLVIRPIPSDHCLYAYIKKGKKEIDICVCLTCKKGTIEDHTVSNSARWVTLHSRSKACRDNHKAALAHIKAYVSSHVSTEEAAPPAPVVAPTITPPVHTCPVVSEDTVLDTFWRSAKATESRRELMNFVESNAHALATLDSDDDESDRLSGKDFLLQLIDTAIGRNKDLNKYKSRVLQLENTVDTQSSRIEQLEDTCAMLKEQIKYLTESHEELKLLHSQCKPA